MAKQRILVVEDHDDQRRLFRLALSLAGYRVDEARSGFEALRQLDAGRPDLVVLDLGLPGIDGFTVQQEIYAQTEGRQIPIVIVTSSSRDLSGLDVACVLRKPFTPEDLVKAVRECLRSESPSVGT